MTRDQAKAILKNIDLIRHFAEGGEIAHRLINCSGQQVAIYPTNKIVLTNMSPTDHCLYVMIKKRLRWNAQFQCYEHVPRYFPTKVKANEIIDRGNL